jgi:hypothetical protein
MTDAPIFYRFRDYIADEYLDGVTAQDIASDEDALRLVKDTFRGFKRTRQGWWVKASYYAARPHFILDLTDEERGRKFFPPRRYAYDSEELALKAYRRRKEMQRWHAEMSLARANRGMAMARERLSAMEPSTVTPVSTIPRTIVEVSPCAATSPA